MCDSNFLDCSVQGLVNELLGLLGKQACFLVGMARRTTSVEGKHCFGTQRLRLGYPGFERAEA